MYKKYGLTLVLGLFLTACGGSSSSSSKEEQLGNFKIEDIEVVAKSAAGSMKYKDQFTVNYHLVAEDFADSVSNEVDIDFYMVKVLHDSDASAEVIVMDEDDDTNSTNDSHFIMSLTESDIQNGSYQRTVEMKIPSIGGMDGEYMLVAMVDPNNEYKETNEDDNWPTLEMIDAMSPEERENTSYSDIMAHSMIMVEAPETNDFLIDDYGIGQYSIIFDTPAHMLDEEKMTSLVVGYVEARYTGNNQATVILTATVNINGAEQSLEFFNADEADKAAGIYMSSMAYTFAIDDNRDIANEAHLGFDLVFSKAQVQELYDSYDRSISNTLKISLDLQPADSMSLDEVVPENNKVEFEIPYYFFAGDDAPESANSDLVGDASTNPFSSSLPLKGVYSKSGAFDASHENDLVRNKSDAVSQIKLEKSYLKTYGNTSKIAAEIELAGGAGIDVTRGGGNVYANGAFNVYMFDAKNTVAGLDFEASAYALDESGYSLEVTLLNAAVYQAGEAKEMTDEEKSESMKKTDKEKDEDNKSLSWTYEYEKKWERSRDLVKSRFFVGPIPISVSAGVNGAMSFGVEAGFNGKLFFEGDLLGAEFGAYAKGGINLLIVEAGIQIALVIIENHFNAEASVGLLLFAVTDDGIDFQPKITYGASLVDELDVIKGKFGLYADVFGVQWCKKWFFYYPCGTNTTNYTFWFYQTPSLFNKTFTLYSREGEINLQ
jgi:hypothetical protein